MRNAVFNYFLIHSPLDSRHPIKKASLIKVETGKSQNEIFFFVHFLVWSERFVIWSMFVHEILLVLPIKKNLFKVFSSQHENILLTFFISFICRYWNHIFYPQMSKIVCNWIFRDEISKFSFRKFQKFLEQFWKSNFLILNLDFEVFLKSNKSFFFQFASNSIWLALYHREQRKCAAVW